MTNNSTPIDWSKFQSEYIKWLRTGQIVEGHVLDIGIGSYQGKEFPELKIRTESGDTVTLSASQAVLMRSIADDPPSVGDSIYIEYLGEAETAKPGQAPAKLFAVKVTHRGADAPTGADLV